MPEFVSQGGDWIEKKKFEQQRKKDEVIVPIVEPVNIKPIVEKPKKKVVKKAVKKVVKKKKSK